MGVHLLLVYLWILQVAQWLECAQQHARDCLWEGEGSPPPDLTENLIRCLSRHCPQLPLSYSFTPISQLLAFQHSPCVSLLGWSTERYKRWCQEQVELKEATPSPNKPLPRVHLLLVGYITDLPPGESAKHDGNLYVRDRSGCIPCEVLHFDLSCLGALVVLPCWSYIVPQAKGSGGGYLEIISPPEPIVPPPVRETPPECVPPLTPHRASALLKDRLQPRPPRVTVTGRVSRVTSLLSIRHKTFFFFFLQDQRECVPVIVQVSPRLSWYHALRVGETYTVTSLSVSSLRGSSHQVFAVTSSSCLLSSPEFPLPDPVSPAEEISGCSPPGHVGQEIQEERSYQQKAMGVGEKQAKTLTYQGVLTRVVDPRAGLYELDGKVMLCTAYLQLLNGGRGLREGAGVEISDTHLQQSPSPLFPPIVLSCCLRSRLRVTQFSRLCTPLSPVSTAGNLHLHLQFRYHLRLPEYLWACDVSRRLQEKLCPSLVKPRCLQGSLGAGPPGVTEKLLSETLSSFSASGPRCERDLQGEILKEPHECPLREYSPLSPPWSLPALSLLQSVVSDSRYLRAEESTRSLRWTHHSLQPQELRPSLRLLGVLHASPSGRLVLKDQSASVPCLVLPRPPSAWIGCTIEVCHYRLLGETAQDTEKGTSSTITYVQFLLSDARILHLPHDCPTCPPAASLLPRPCKLPKLDGPSASRLFLVRGVEGLVPIPGHDGGFQFQAQAVWLGAPELLTGQVTEREEEQRASWDEEHRPLTKVLLLFCHSAARWFHFLQPNRVYRLIATGEKDLEIFHRQPEDSVQMSSCPVCFRIPCEWALRDVKAPDPPPWPREEPLSVDQALKSSSAGSLLNVTGVVTHRTLCDAQNTRMFPPSGTITESFLPHGVSLKVTVAELDRQAALSVYMNPAGGPYCLGLLPGATILIQGLERKISRAGAVYLRSVPVTCVRVLSAPAESNECLLVPKFTLFSELPRSLIPHRAVCSIACVLSVTLAWVCAACEDVFRAGHCSRSSSCTSQSGVFRAKAWVKAEDGSGEAHIQLQDGALLAALGVPQGLWEALQGRVLSRGEVRVQNRGRNYEVPGEMRSEDALSCYVSHLVSRPAVSRPLILTFKQLAASSRPLPAEPSHLRRFTRGERDYMTHVPPPPTLICLGLEEVEPGTLCRLIQERN
uniref:CST complex subunit CTC1 n=2 Tax=Xenopus tropicalis TaxID=8364 RepID=A0A6I8Q005_XENTR